MSSDFSRDLHEMHAKYGFHESVEKLSRQQAEDLLQFRADFLGEELDEMQQAIIDRDPEGVVDALIDLIVVAVGTLDLFEVDTQRAWDAVHEANMSKERGINPNRVNPLGLPDLVKPTGWTPPSHEGNHGTIADIWSE